MINLFNRKECCCCHKKKGLSNKITKIVEKPTKRFGWYIVKASDLKPKVKEKKKMKLKLDKMKGGLK